ncbi:ABC transporter substrate-binding protein [Micromonospora sp. NBC_01813]|uniref:ABC transporter substrate-binding protein n=1 Tax=Micromonospora sp. NBC_01813 TaxID=2975988 RepID=UPI002DD91B15|nr:ABC transporter substrate-binding protein [Micromonospora sp. NBC_01813]WSA10792.1 ABC transporter substrate-binding protein [Micromonospora sp. NBC_01813]
MNNRWRVPVAAVAVAMTVAACGEATRSPDPQASAPGEGYPVTVQECDGKDVTVAQKPERVVPLSATMLEYLFWLGVEDAVVGSGESVRPGTFPPQFQAAGEQVRSLTGPYVPGSYDPVSREVLLAERPDLVISDFTSTFEASGAASQADLAERGIASYLAFSTDCAPVAAAQTTLDLVYRDLDNVGRLMGVPQRAQELVTDMRATVADVQSRVADADRPTVWAYTVEEAQETSPGSALGNRHTVNAVIELAGGRNVFGDLDDSFAATTWEEIPRRDPDVILLLSYGYGGEQERQEAFAAGREALATNPATRSMRAVREERFATLDYWLVGAGSVRNADGVAELARQLHPDAFR